MVGLDVTAYNKRKWQKWQERLDSVLWLGPPTWHCIMFPQLYWSKVLSKFKMRTSETTPLGGSMPPWPTTVCPLVTNYIHSSHLQNKHAIVSSFDMRPRLEVQVLSKSGPSPDEAPQEWLFSYSSLCISRIKTQILLGSVVIPINPETSSDKVLHSNGIIFLVLC